MGPVYCGEYFVGRALTFCVAEAFCDYHIITAAKELYERWIKGFAVVGHRTRSMSSGSQGSCEPALGGKAGSQGSREPALGGKGKGSQGSSSSRDHERGKGAGKGKRSHDEGSSQRTTAALSP